MAEIRLTHEEVLHIVAEMQHVIDVLEATEEYHMVMILDDISNTLLRKLFRDEQ